MRRNIVEWLVLVGGALSVLALVAALVGQSIGSSRPPVIEATVLVDEAAASDLGWTVPVEVRNVGGRSAAGVVIDAVATVGGVEEVASVDIDLLAGSGRAVRVIAFSAEPEGDVQLRLVGYTAP